MWQYFMAESPMTDKYTLQETEDEYGGYLRVNGKASFTLYEKTKAIANIRCTQEIANLIDKCLNQTSRAGSKTSQAKRDAAKKNIAKRWEK